MLFIDLKASEIAEIAEKIASLPAIDIKVIAEAFDQDSDREGFKKDIIITDIILSWYKSTKDIQEPRRVFARKISELGDQLSQSCESEDQQKEVKAAFTRMAKDVDIYFDPA